MAQQKYKSEPIKEGQKKSNIKHQSFGTQALPPPKPTAITKTNKPMAQQTAVEWFAYQVEKMLFDLKKNNDVFQLELCLHGLNELEEQAKRMFEEQIIAACNQTDVIGLDHEQPGEQYYTETYGK